MVTSWSDSWQVDQVTSGSKAGDTLGTTMESPKLVWRALGSHRGFIGKGGTCPEREFRQLHEG